MMIILNGKSHEFSENLNVMDLLASEGYKDKIVAVAINNAFVPKETYADRILQDNDHVEIVAPMQGG